MDSDNNSTNTIFHTTSQFNNSDIETPDEFADSEPRTSTFSNSPFNPYIPKSPMNLPQLLPPTLMQPQSTPPMTSDTNHSSPVDTELENELDNFINLQKLLQHPNTLTIHHLSQIMTSSESSNSPSTTGKTRAHRVIKQKLPNTPFPSHPRPAQTFMNYPLHTNTKEFL